MHILHLRRRCTLTGAQTHWSPCQCFWHTITDTPPSPRTQFVLREAVCGWPMAQRGKRAAAGVLLSSERNAGKQGNPLRKKQKSSEGGAGKL